MGERNLDEFELFKLVGQLGTEEVTVLTEVARRLLLGQNAYGKLELSKDPRDFEAEGEMELLDWVVYQELVKLQAKAKA